MPIECFSDHAAGASAVFGHDVCVSLRHLDAAMAEHIGDELQGNSACSEPACIGVPKGVEDDFLAAVGNPRVESQFPDDSGERVRTCLYGVLIVHTETRKKRLMREQTTILSENVLNGWRKVGVSVVSVFGIADSNEATLKIDIGANQLGDLSEAQAAVQGQQRCGEPKWITPLREFIKQSLRFGSGQIAQALVVQGTQRSFSERVFASDVSPIGHLGHDASQKRNNLVYGTRSDALCVEIGDVLFDVFSGDACDGPLAKPVGDVNLEIGPEGVRFHSITLDPVFQVQLPPFLDRRGVSSLFSGVDFFGERIAIRNAVGSDGGREHGGHSRAFAPDDATDACALGIVVVDDVREVRLALERAGRAFALEDAIKASFILAFGHGISPHDWLSEYVRNMTGLFLFVSEICLDLYTRCGGMASDFSRNREGLYVMIPFVPRYAGGMNYNPTKSVLF